MIIYEHNISLKPYNTFGIEVNAAQLISFNKEGDIDEMAPVLKDSKWFVLGGGSNMLFIEDFNGIILKPKMKQIEIVDEKEDFILLKVGAGYDWDDFVQYCVDNGYGGIENLSLIPGTVGASPIQNIGAYGVEVKDVVKRVCYYHVDEQKFLSLEKDQCQFGYRDSVFKNELKGKVIVTNVLFRLTKNHHIYKTHYGNIEEELKDGGDLSLSKIRNAIVAIRNNKLPDPELVGNAGSFFKNSVVDIQKYEDVKKLFPQVPGFEIKNKQMKIPAAWLIDQCGWKGKVLGNAGVHNNQPLVLVNATGHASGKEILELANKITEDVRKKFDIVLEMEVNIL